MRRWFARSILLVTTAAVGTPLLLCAQAPQLSDQKAPAFEVASVKPGVPGATRFGIQIRGNQFLVTNAPLKIMIGDAYGIQNHQILGGPKWIISDRFNIEARPGAGVRMGSDPEGIRMQRLMLQSLLEDRFKLRVHRETRMEQVYELVVAKGGPKLKPSAGPGADGRQGIFARGFGGLAVTNQPIQSLAGILSQRLGRSVIDKTGLSGKYDFELSFMPEVSPGDLELFGPPPPEALPPADSGLPSIFTALQDQIGLKLESARGPVEVLVIDHVEEPSGN